MFHGGGCIDTVEARHGIGVVMEGESVVGGVGEAPVVAEIVCVTKFSEGLDGSGGVWVSRGTVNRVICDVEVTSEELWGWDRAH